MPHCIAIRNNTYTFLNFNQSKSEDFGEMKHVRLKPKWITLQNQASGFAVKLTNGYYFNGIHVWKDSNGTIDKKYEACRANYVLLYL